MEKKLATSIKLEVEQLAVESFSIDPFANEDFEGTYDTCAATCQKDTGKQICAGCN